MSAAQGPPAGWGDGDDAGVRAEALDVVLDALQWRLAGARWQTIAEVLAAMEAALEAGDPRALAAATADLELAGPLRIIRIGATEAVPPAPPVRSQLNRLVHSLGGVTATRQQPPGQAGTGDDDASSS